MTNEMRITNNYPYDSAAGNQESGGQSQHSGDQTGEQAGQGGTQPQEGTQGQDQGQGQGQDQNQGQGSQEANQEGEQYVPLSALKQVRAENQAIKQQMANIQAQQQQSMQQPANAQTSQGETVDSILSKYDDDDVLTVADYKKIRELQTSQQQPAQPQMQQPQPGVADPRENEMRANYPDYDQKIEVIGQILTPDLKQTIQNAPNPFFFAYQVANAYLQGQGQQSQGQPQASTQGGTQGQQQAQQVQQNLQRPGTAGSASGGGGISRTGYYAEMSDEELEKRAQAVKRGG